MALTSFLTGVTEPIEFAFMFLAPLLYLVHAVLTGVALVIMSLLNVKLGFTFSAGLFDYVISFNKGTNPLLLLPIGAIYFVVYYGMFRIVITKFNLLTLGREPEVSGQAMQSLVEGVRPVQVPVSVPGAVIEPGPGGLPATARGSMQIPPVGGPQTRGLSYLAALGGAANVLEIEACATRLRLSLVDNGRLDEAALKQLGVRGVLRLTAGSAQIIIGPLADQVAVEIQDAMKSPGSSASA
jgi:PTS system N-acetylglucosamine-specific IIC component